MRLALSGALVLCAVIGACTPRLLPVQVQLPPAKYQGNRTVAAFSFLDPDAVPAACGQTNGEILGGKVVSACTRIAPAFTEVILPNPFKWPITDLATWTLIAMHELGHANGWPADHPSS